MVTKIKKSKKKIPLVFAVAFVLISVAGTVWFINKDDKASRQATDATASSIDYGPPSEEVIQETEQNKKELEQKFGSQNSSQPANSGSGANQASAVLTNLAVDQQEVRGSGIITNVFEENGTCTLTLTKGTVSVSGTSQGFVDVNKTTCPPISISRNKLSSGEWLGVLSYNSSTSSGSSAIQKVNIP